MKKNAHYAMKHISILVYEDAILSAISGALEILTGTNRYLKGKGSQEAFTVDLVSEQLRNIQLLLPAQFICHKTLSEVIHTDLIIVPAFYGSPDEVLKKNVSLIKWISTMRNSGVEVASLCLGSYFLAEAGLLTRKPCTSHWRAIDDMQDRYPDVNVLPEAVVTDQDGIYTSGGAFLSLNLVLYLVEKFCGRETAIQMSKTFSVDMDRVNQSHFSVFKGQRRHNDKEILRIQNYIENNYTKSISISELAEQSHMSRRNFIRRFKKATKNTPLEYVQRVKIEAAKKALESGNVNISSLIYDVGYSDVKTFRMIFKRITGLTPLEYRSKYNRGEA